MLSLDPSESDSSSPAFVEQVGVEVGFDAEPRFRPLDVDDQRFFGFDGDPEGVVFGRLRG